MPAEHYLLKAYEAKRPALRAIARYNGLHMDVLHLWTLLTPLPGLLVGSTYAEATLERALANQPQPGAVPAFGEGNVPTGPKGTRGTDGEPKRDALTLDHAVAAGWLIRPRPVVIQHFPKDTVHWSETHDPLRFDAVADGGL